MKLIRNTYSSILFNYNAFFNFTVMYIKKNATIINNAGESSIVHQGKIHNNLKNIIQTTSEVQWYGSNGGPMYAFLCTGTQILKILLILIPFLGFLNRVKVRCVTDVSEELATSILNSGLRLNIFNFNQLLPYLSVFMLISTKIFYLYSNQY